MSKAGDFVRKVEEEIESIFAGGHTETEDTAGNPASHSQYTVIEDELAVPEIHTGKAEHMEGEHAQTRPAGENKKDGEEAGSPAEEEEKPTIRFDTVAVPEIHVHHKKKS